MNLDTAQMETRILVKILTTPTSDYNSVKIIKDEILGLYVYGSKLWGTNNENSDSDYAVVLSDTASVWKFYEKQYVQSESEDVDIHIMSESYYKNLVIECDEFGLSLFVQEYPLIKYETGIEYKDLSLQNLRKSFSSKANNSYVKAKKKLIDGEINIAYKSMYHSLRILDLGKDIATAIKEEGKIYDLTSYGENIEYIADLFEQQYGNWDYIHKICKPLFNAYATEFRKMAPKA